MKKTTMSVRLFSCFVTLSLCYFVTLLFHTSVQAQTCDSSCSNADECKSKITKCQEAWNQMESAKKPHVDALRKMEADIVAFQERIKILEADIVKKAAAISVGEQELSGHLVLANRRIREFYIKSFAANPFNMLLSSSSVGSFLRTLAYQQTVINEDKKAITQTAVSVHELEERKKNLEKEKSTISYLNEEMDKRAASVRKLVNDANAYQTKLTGIIGSLTALQESILNAKTGTFQTSVGDVPLADDPASSPDYNPGFSPAFAAFSFGAPHFKGMSQYGAFGRAKAGQSAEDILRAYYGDVEIKKDYDPGRQIGVSGFRRMDIETYVKRIYEMPGSWGDEGGMAALRAQAVAARSYALAWTREGTGGDICTTQACQVYKDANKGGKWEDAVNDTKGWVLYKNGKIVSAWYASTSGGYQESYNALAYLQDGSSFNTPSFWDTPSGRSGWTSSAYEKTAGSPWFYKGWFRGSSGDSCGRNHPWLNSEEMADIVNAWVVLFQGGGDGSRVTPQGSCWGGNPYSTAELRSIGNYTSVSGVSVTYSEGGTTATVMFQTNKGSISIAGNDFYKAFNLRAPGRISLKSGLYNIEKK